MPVSDDTMGAGGDSSQNLWARRVRRVTIAGLTLIVLLGLVGVFGEKTSTASASGSGYRLSVTYARVSRAGLDTPWTVVVSHPGGFGADVTLATTSGYFTMFETQGLTPEPDSEVAGARDVYQTFSPPPGDVLKVEYDAYIQPSSQQGRTAVTTLIVGGRPVAKVGYRTRLLP